MPKRAYGDRKPLGLFTPLRRLAPHRTRAVATHIYIRVTRTSVTFSLFSMTTAMQGLVLVRDLEGQPFGNGAMEYPDEDEYEYDVYLFWPSASGSPAISAASSSPKYLVFDEYEVRSVFTLIPCSLTPLDSTTRRHSSRSRVWKS
jgi:hypothetical protein